MNLQQKGFRHQWGKNEKKEEELCYVLILNHLPAACCEATWHQTLVMVSFSFSEVNLLLWRWKTHVAEAFILEIHHHLLPFYSAGSQDRQVSVKRCWQQKKSNRVRLVLTFFIIQEPNLFSLHNSVQLWGWSLWSHRRWHHTSLSAWILYKVMHTSIRSERRDLKRYSCSATL